MTDISFESLFQSASALTAGGDKKSENALDRSILNIPRPLQSDSLTFTIQLPRYRAYFVKPDDTASPMVQTARQLYFKGEGRWLVGIVDGVITVLASDAHSHFPDVSVSSHIDALWDEGVCDVLQYSLVFELNRSYNWICIGPDISTLTVSEVITTPNQRGHKNVAVVTVTPLQASTLQVNMQVNRYFPIDLDEMRHNPHQSYNVTVLPHLVDALCTTSRSEREPPPNLRSPQGLAAYWLARHGLGIPEACLRETVNVVFPTSGVELVYPAVCVWRHKWSFLPLHSREYLPAMRERLNRELWLIRNLWIQNLSRSIHTSVTIGPIQDVVEVVAPTCKDTKRRRRK
jgi:hypothetical protein